MGAIANLFGYVLNFLYNFFCDFESNTNSNYSISAKNNEKKCQDARKIKGNTI